MDPSTVANAVQGQDAVMCTIGAGVEGTVRTEGTKHIVRAMEEAGVRRLICGSALGVGDSWENLSVEWKKLVKGPLCDAYDSSKLCTVLTARWLSAHPDVRARRLRVVAYDPGQVFGTGLANKLSLPLRIAWSLLGTPVLEWPLRKLNRDLNSRTAAGNTLAELALGPGTPPNGRTYAALRRGRLTWPEPSELARSDELAQTLWDDSAELVGQGLPPPGRSHEGTRDSQISVQAHVKRRP